MADQQTAPGTLCLLGLPDPALLSVLRCLAANPGLSSLFSAARAHSTLHKLSAAALTNINVSATQQQLDRGLLLYLARHSGHVQSLELTGTSTVCWTTGQFHSPLLVELPPGLQLQRLSLSRFQLQLLLGGGRAGVLQPGASLKQLELLDCELVDIPCQAALEQALLQLPQLEHLCYHHCTLPFPSCVLSHLQQLTSLDVQYAEGDVLEHVDLLPDLLDLRASVRGDSSGNKLSALQQLTALVLSPRGGRLEDDSIDTACLANKSQLQHLDMSLVRVAGGPAGVSSLLSHLQQMAQLTHLALRECWGKLGRRYDGPPAAAYAALTASSQLKHLNVGGYKLPPDVWQHVLPADRQLLQLHALQTCCFNEHGHPWTHADTARLASCCPNLQRLSLRAREPAHVLQPLRSLAALTALDDAGFAAAAALTQLQSLTVQKAYLATDAGLLQLTQLRQLTQLASYGCTYGLAPLFTEKANVPVWRQVLQQCLWSQQPGVAQLAQQAAASLEQVAP